MDALYVVIYVAVFIGLYFAGAWFLRPRHKR